MMLHRSTVSAVLKVVCSLWLLLSIAGCMRTGTSPDSQVPVPKNRPSNTIAVFPFRWNGDGDAKFYAAGFFRALSDRLYGTADCQINQPNMNAIQEQLDRLKQPFPEPISDNKAISAAKVLGTHYVLTGDFALGKDTAEVSINLIDLTAKSPKPSVIRRSGKVSDLPKMQTDLATDVIKAMGIDPRKALAGSAAAPNFSKPSILLLHGRSCYSEKLEDALSLRWRCVKEDPDSLFAALRVLGTYVYGNVKCMEIRSDRRLQTFIPDVGERFPDNCQVAYITGRLYYQQYQYKKSQEYMRAAVKRFPDYTGGHGVLAAAAMERGETALALAEARKVAELWPTNPNAHVLLAQAYGNIADSERRQMNSFGAKTFWAMWNRQRSSNQAYREASIALALDPRDLYAWQVVMDVSRDLGYPGYDYKAFQQMVKLDPKYHYAYSAYLRSLGRDNRDQFFARVDRVFGKDSAEACLLRGWHLRDWADSEVEHSEVLRLADKALAKSKGDILPALSLKTEALISLHKRAEMLELAKKGYALDPSPYWSSLLAKGYEFRWEDMHDPSALNAAYKLWTHYVDEFPDAAYGHDHLGWCLSHMGQRAAAKKEFERALQIDPGDRFAREKMAYVR